MANPNTEGTTAPEKAVETKPAAPVKAAVQESVYSAEELIANFRAFKTSKEIVTVALRKSGKKSVTFAEAKSIVEKFKKKEV